MRFNYLQIHFIAVYDIINKCIHKGLRLIAEIVVDKLQIKNKMFSFMVQV